jgi:ComF family protein
MWSAWWPAVCAGCGAVGAERLCGSCRAHGAHRPSLRVEGVRGGWTLADYDSALGEAVRAAKVRGDRALMQTLGELMARRIARYVEPAVFTALVPAPSTSMNLLRRGFGPASVLAEALARSSGVPRVECLRRSSGSRQAGLSRAARRSNLAGRVQATGEVRGRVLMVDDVLTTGATALACATELLCAGASEVWIATLCVARARGARTGAQEASALSAMPPVERHVAVVGR